MKRFVLILACLLLLPSAAGASLFGASDDEEISPLQYSALLGLRDVDPELFRTKLLPLIEEAMQDGKITAKELSAIEKAAGSVSASFLKAAKEPRLEDRFADAAKKAREGGRDLGDKLGDVLGDQLPQMLDETMKLFRDQMRQHETDPQDEETTTL